MIKFKPLAKAALSAAGYEIGRIVPPPPRKPDLLIQQKIDLVFDVGANTGQYATHIREFGYAKRIVSFEPLPDAHAALLGAVLADPLWQVHERCALGPASGTAEINVSENSYSSSLLPMAEAHLSAAPDSAYIATAATPVITLDSVFGKYASPGDRVFLKIDVQGFERQVLEGAEASLPAIHGLRLELSTKVLYESQDTYVVLMALLDAAGFELWDIAPGFRDPGGQLLQFDAVMFRPEDA